MATPLQDKAFLGVGWAFPVAPDPTGEAALAAYEEDVRQAIEIILGTDPGERVMRPDFGAGLHALVFEPIGATTAALVRHRVEEALVQWEPRIDVLEVRVSQDGPLGNRLLVGIDYRIRSTNTFYNLVYPFYLLEGEPA
ncbi:MAG: GPW/gp25 family protein [Gaiellaceae bacterium]